MSQGMVSSYHLEGWHYIKSRKRTCKYKVSVCRNPENQDRYSYAVAIDGGVMGGSEHLSAPTLHGCFALPAEALKVGMKVVFEM